MISTDITQAQLNKLQYIELLQENYKTPEQRLTIELKEREKAKKRYIKARQRLVYKSSTQYFNHLRAYVDNDSVTEEMIEREIELWFKWEQYGQYDTGRTGRIYS